MRTAWTWLQSCLWLLPPFTTTCTGWQNDLVLHSLHIHFFLREGAVPCPPDPAKDWSANFCEMIGYKDPQFTELMRLYLTIHRLAIE